jgi:hypothetical protein
MRLFGYTLGQMFVIGLIAIVSIYLLHKLDQMVQVPGIHALANGT